MKKIIPDFFFYNRKQKIGVIVFGLLTLLNVVIISLDPFPVIDQTDYSALIREMDSIDKIQLLTDQKIDYNEYNYERNDQPKKLFSFDPNKASEDDFRSLGIPEKVASRILNFRNKGGTFRSPQDLQKIYGMPPEVFDEIERFVLINQEEKIKEINQFNIEKNREGKERFFVEINTADSAQLCKIKGIGPTFARRILKYREKLGGFIKKEQLGEIYGIDSLRYKEIAAGIHTDIEKVRRIPVNLISEAELSKHPYAGFKLSKKIIAYRTQHGKFSSLEEIERIESISPAELEKIKPYLIVQ